MDGTFAALLLLSRGNRLHGCLGKAMVVGGAADLAGRF